MGFQTKIYSSQPGLPAHREVLLQRSSVQLLFSCSVQNGQFSLRKIKVMMLRKASTKTPTRTFQFSENFQVGVFLVTIKHYLLQVFEERNLLFKDRACKKSIRLFSIIARHVNMFEHSWIECFQDNCALDLTVRLRIFFFSHGGVSSTKNGRYDLSSPVRHKTLLSPTEMSRSVTS